MRRWLALAFLLAGCATARPCEITDDTGRTLDIGMACACTGHPVETLTCRRSE